MVLNKGYLRNKDPQKEEMDQGSKNLQKVAPNFLTFYREYDGYILLIF